MDVLTYFEVQKALQAGDDPAALCATCPWDRYCIVPPSAAPSDIEKQIDQGREIDRKRARAATLAGTTDATPGIGVLLMAAMYGTKDIEACVCPVLALRLKTQGRPVVDALKAQMQAWNDPK